jgi:hypothetical protein
MTPPSSHLCTSKDERIEELHHQASCLQQLTYEAWQELADATCCHKMQVEQLNNKHNCLLGDYLGLKHEFSETFKEMNDAKVRVLVLVLRLLNGATSSTVHPLLSTSCTWHAWHHCCSWSLHLLLLMCDVGATLCESHISRQVRHKQAAHSAVFRCCNLPLRRGLSRHRLAADPTRAQQGAAAEAGRHQGECP